MSGKQLAFSVKIKDCVVQTFRAGGKGGQNQNKRDTGVRIIHPPSGAVGEARDGRGQKQNKRSAFERMALSPKFNHWARVTVLGLSQDLNHKVEDDMKDVVIEYGPLR